MLRGLVYTACVTPEHFWVGCSDDAAPAPPPGPNASTTTATESHCHHHHWITLPAPPPGHIASATTELHCQHVAPPPDHIDSCCCHCPFFVILLPRLAFIQKFMAEIISWQLRFCVITVMKVMWQRKSAPRFCLLYIDLNLIQLEIKAGDLPSLASECHRRIFIAFRKIFKFSDAIHNILDFLDFLDFFL